MQFPGHLAIAIAQYRLVSGRAPEETAMKPLLLASLFPDMVDKSIGYVFQVMPNGRHYAHNIFSLILVPSLITLIWGKKVGFSWFVGYLGHLLADIKGTGIVPWLFPLKKYHFKKGRLRFEPTQLLRESIFLGLVLLIYRLSR